MNYTIAMLDEVHGECSLNLDSHGNKYLVGLYNKTTKDYAHRTLDSIDGAYDVFETLSKAICLGLYSFADKKKLLMVA
jgi:hypothetical protein